MVSPARKGDKSADQCAYKNDAKLLSITAMFIYGLPYFLYCRMSAFSVRRTLCDARSNALLGLFQIIHWQDLFCMPNSQNRNLTRINAIDDAAIAPDEFPNVLARGFGYLSAALREWSQWSDARESVANPFLCGDRIAFCNVGSDFRNTIDGQWCPLHLDRRSFASTCLSAAS